MKKGTTSPQELSVQRDNFGWLKQFRNGGDWLLRGLGAAGNPGILFSWAKNSLVRMPPGPYFPPLSTE